MAELQRTSAEEVIVAAPGDGTWHFTEGNLSSLFKFAAGDEWHATVYAPYYKEFWAPVIKELDKLNSPVEIILSCVYDYGNLQESDLHGLMDTWRTNRLTRTKPNMLAVSEKNSGSDEVTTVHVVVDRYEIRALSEID